ncbi:ankyrin repeat-containing domain protein [Mycena polygramma]|nr:ankyrin repeat-containing domain protein [Mycena polygramma]KAJ7665025.1 ankyrin repeat-containing domain protein [Mycena polygramma]
MAQLSDLPPELILHVVSFLPLRVLDPESCPTESNLYADTRRIQVPDLSSINALFQTSIALHSTLNQTLYDLCASVEALGSRALLFSATHQQETAVEQLVAVGVSLDTEFIFERHQCGILHITASMGLEAMVAKVLQLYGNDMPAWVYRRDGIPRHSMHDRATALDYAARKGHMDIVKLLAPIPITPPGLRRKYLSVALLEAANRGNVPISKYLISEGADVHFIDNTVDLVGPALHVATYTLRPSKNLGVVQLLLASGAEPNLPGGNNTGIPLHNAAFSHNLDIVRALLTGGANINIRDREGRNVLAYCRSVEVLRFCLQRGADPNAADHRGETPLHYACRKGSAELAEPSVQLLLQFGAGPVDRADQMGETAVDVAMRANRTEVVKILEPHVQTLGLRQRISDWWAERKTRVAHSVPLKRITVVPQP